IVAAPPNDPNCGSTKGQSIAAVPPNFALKPGRRERNFWMRRQAPKIAAQRRERIQRPKFGNWAAEIPAETPYLASYRKRAVCGDWMVVCAVRCEPVSLLFG